jgi:hypothetical protein
MTNSVKFIVRGSVRGLISTHRSLSKALASESRDRRQCSRLGGGSYSDATVYAYWQGRQYALSWADDGSLITRRPMLPPEIVAAASR